VAKLQQKEKEMRTETYSHPHQFSRKPEDKKQDDQWHDLLNKQECQLYFYNNLKF
jgi:hypothetical protein